MNLNEYYMKQLLEFGGKKEKNFNSIEYASKELVIKRKDTGHKYTIKKIILNKDGKPIIKAEIIDIPKNDMSFYNHIKYDPAENIKNIIITPKDYNKYERA